MSGAAACKGCGVTIRVPEREVRRILDAYLAEHPQAVAADGEYARRLSCCRACPELLDGTTCRHCGCLVAVRAKLAAQECPDPAGSRWADRPQS